MSEIGRRYRPRRWERYLFTPEGKEFYSPERNRFREAGRRALQKGWRHEMRVARAFYQRRAEWPPWLLNVRHGTEAEDRSGIDFVFETSDAGDLILQVKSSAFQAIEFVEREAGRQEKRWIKVLIVHIDHGKPEVYEKALEVIAGLRLRRIRTEGRILRSRTGSEEAEAAE